MSTNGVPGQFPPVGANPQVTGSTEPEAQVSTEQVEEQEALEAGVYLIFA